MDNSQNKNVPRSETRRSFIKRSSLVAPVTIFGGSLLGLAGNASAGAWWEYWANETATKIGEIATQATCIANGGNGVCGSPVRDRYDRVQEDPYGEIYKWIECSMGYGVVVCGICRANNNDYPNILC